MPVQFQGKIIQSVKRAITVNQKETTRSKKEKEKKASFLDFCIYTFIVCV